MNRDNSMQNLICLADKVDPKLASNLAESFARLEWVLSSHQISPERRRKALALLNTYLNKKSEEFDPLKVAENAASLRQIRNELAHGKTRREKDFSPLYPFLWKAIGRLANKIGPEQIEDLLAYSLHHKNIGVSTHGVSPIKVIAVYRPLFNALEPEVKRKAFTELLLRLFSDSESIMLLDAEP